MLASHRSITPTGRALALIVLGAFAVPGAAWAFAPSMLPNIAIWNNYMAKIHQPAATKIYEEDQDGDGVIDLEYFRHEDGAYIEVRWRPGPEGMVIDHVVLKDNNQRDKSRWVYGFNKDDDGQIELLVRGMFAENKWSQMIYDSDRDGKPDKFLLDMDENGVYDFMGADENGDGRLDVLSDLDNETGALINETVGWVVFEEEQHANALPQLVYSFMPTLDTLTGQEAIVVGATWNFGDGVVRAHDELITGEHLYREAGEYEVQLDVQFKLPGDERVYKAWYGVALPVKAGAPGPAPITAERLTASVNTFFEACGYLMADETPRVGSITELWPELTLPEGAPIGQALKAAAIAGEELQLTAFWWRSDAEAGAFLDALEATGAAPELSAMAVRSPEGQPFELARRVRAHLIDKDGGRTAAWRENGFIIVIKTNLSVGDLHRWTRTLYDILHPAPTPPAP